MLKNPLTALALLLPVIALLLVTLQTRERPVDLLAEPAPWMQVPVVSRNALAPIPNPPEVDADVRTLGERLFHEPRLSRDGTVACASCHHLHLAGGDSRTHAMGIDGQVMPLNTPTVFNAALHHAQFHDGRVSTLEEQVAGPLHSQLEMDSSWDVAIAALRDDPSYVESFGKLYAEGITSTTIAHAIASFERTLLTPDSRFDRYLHGDHNALDERERAGYKLFLRRGCASCHQGAAIGGNLFQRFGVMEDYYADRAAHAPASPGRIAVTGREEDRHVYKVPSLRNVAVTGPYLHDGSVESLSNVVALMGHYQLGLQLSTDEIELITAFLTTLTGSYRGVELK